jgi:thiamine-monophosphate kinase
MDKPLGEFDLIRRYFAHAGAGAARADVVLGVGDDAALLKVPANCELVAAVDTVVAGRHFLHGCDARSIGHRALAVNLSDLAAMGATPAWATLALTLPRADRDWLAGFAAGFADLAHTFGVALVGGDTTAGPLTISVQVLGYVATGTALRRGGAQAGDLLVVTGTLGDAGAGLAYASGARVGTPESLEAVRQLVRRFEYPTPRVEFGMAARGLASAALDLSDGLVGDLPKLAAASGLAAQVEVERLPLSSALEAVADPEQARDWALAAGDDYELLLAVPPHRFAELQAVAARLNLTLSAIGHLSAGNTVSWTLHGKPFEPAVRGFDHFR